MTVAALAPSIEYLEDGVSVNFPVPFRFNAPTHITARSIAALDGAVIELAYGADYSVTGGATDAGGTLTRTAPGLAGDRLLIERWTPRSQATDYQTNDIFPAETHEAALDRAMLIDQEQDALLFDIDERALMVPVGETIGDLPPAGERAQGILGFDAAGEPVILPSEELGSVAVVAQRVEYVATAGQTIFATPSTYTVGYLSVYVNGVRLSASEFVATDGAVAVLNEPAEAGDIVALEGFLGSGTVADLNSLTFLQSGAGAVPRGAQDKMRDIAHAFDFIDPSLHAGIVAGTNLDDLSAELNAALAAHPLIRLPTVGTLNIASSLFVPSGGGLIGGGGRSVIKALAGFGDLPLVRNASYLPATLAERDKGMTFRDFKIDGNRANNPAATEFSHGLHLNAVDGVDLNLWVVDCKGDGVVFSYARGLGDGAPANYGVGCSAMRGFIRSDDCYRQGVAVVCGDQFDLTVFAQRAGFFAFDVEPDAGASYARDGVANVIGIACGQNPGNNGGGVAVTGTSADGLSIAAVNNIGIKLGLRDCIGNGVVFRDADARFEGSIIGQQGNGVVGLDANLGPSNVVFALTIGTCTGDGFINRGTNNQINGRIDVFSAGTSGIHIQNAAGGMIHAIVKGAAQQGIILYNSADFTFPNAVVSGCGSHGVWLRAASQRNNFPGLRSINSTFGWGFIEEAGCNDNRCTNARLTANGAGFASLQGAASVAIGEELGGKVNYDPPSLAALTSTNVDVFVTGIMMGDHATTSMSVSTGGIVRAAGIDAPTKVTVEWFNCRSTLAIDGAAGSLEAFVTPKAVGAGVLRAVLPAPVDPFI